MIAEARLSIPLNAAEKGFLKIPPIDNVLYIEAGLPIEQLVASFRETLVAFSLLSSKLVLNGAEPFLYFASDAVELIVGAPVQRSQIRFDRADAYLRTVDDLESNLFRVCLTPVEPEGTLIACSISHILADGFTFVSFLYEWAERCRGRTSQVVRKQHAYSLSAKQAQALRDRGATRDDELKPEPQPWAERREDLLMIPQPVARTLKQIASSRSSGYSASNHASLTAFFLRCFADYLFAYQDIRVRCSMDLRGKLDGLEPNYLGNAWVDAIVPLSIERLHQLTVAELAEEIDRSMSEATSRHSLASLFRVSEGGIQTTELWSSKQEFNAADVPVSDVRRFMLLGPPNFGTGDARFLSTRLSAPVGILFGVGPNDSISVQAWSDMAG